MAKRNNVLLLKRSNVIGKIPSSLELGELALNIADGFGYMSATTANKIVQIGWDKVPLTGGTMSGGLITPTISATTYSNLPLDIYTTGGTYSNGTAIFRNNSGGTFSVSGFSTGISTGLTNTDTFTTGGTYNQNGTAIFTNNTGGTFSVSNFNNKNYVQFETGTTETNAVGKLKWNDTDGTLDLGMKGGNVNLQLGMETLVRVVNKSGSLIPNGKVVKVVANPGGGNTGIALAQADSDANSATVLGLTTEDIANNALGYITIQGLVHELNTNAFTEGDVLYLSSTSAGELTNIKPIAPQHMVIVGYVAKKGVSDGHILMHVQNGYELDELHNVKLSDVTNNQALVYNSSNSLWENKSIINQTILSGNTGTTASEATLFNALALKQNKITDIGIDIGIGIGTTVGVTETILKSILIPANTFTVGNTNSLYTLFERVGGGGGTFLKFRLSNSPTTLGAIVIAQTSYVTVQKYSGIQRVFSFESGNKIRIFTNLIESGGEGGNNNSVLLDFNPAIDNYIQITARNQVAADLTYLRFYRYENKN